MLVPQPMVLQRYQPSSSFDSRRPRDLVVIASIDAADKFSDLVRFEAGPLASRSSISSDGALQ